MKEVAKRCLDKPPPEMLPVPEPTVCMPDTLCMAKADMMAWAENTERLLDRVASDWKRCGTPVGLEEKDATPPATGAGLVR